MVLPPDVLLAEALSLSSLLSLLFFDVEFEEFEDEGAVGALHATTKVVKASREIVVTRLVFIADSGARLVVPPDASRQAEAADVPAPTSWDVETNY